MEPFADALPYDEDDLLSWLTDGTWTPLTVKAPAPEEGSVAESEIGPASPSPDGPSQEAAAPATTPPPSEPAASAVQFKLPGMVSPFDFRTAFEDICAKRRVIDADVERWNKLHKEAADLKKQIDAKEETLAAAVRTFDQARREAEAEAIRQAVAGCLPREARGRSRGEGAGRATDSGGRGGTDFRFFSLGRERTT